MKTNGWDSFLPIRWPLTEAFPDGFAMAPASRILGRFSVTRESNCPLATIRLNERQFQRGARLFAGVASTWLYTVANKPTQTVKNLLKEYRQAKIRQPVANLGLLSQDWEQAC